GGLHGSASRVPQKCRGRPPLEEAGITTIGDLATCTDDELLQLPAFGDRRLAALKSALAHRAGSAA
ncbi:DNA-directed RNA polymerase subunit alpha C-terminal domain-containing protein, partial [Streptomyces albidoflavus]|uniref:DNA-directed RNA polymerase subunit alpha C-terminal domain-containing protein n=1 Tax=Streptomyces albidoflavus TaxID=1886 RepID=UPI00331BF261